MAILNAQVGQTGLSGILPQIIYIDTNDTLAEVTTAGYLNTLVAQNFPLSESMMALVSMRATPSATSVTVGFFDVAKSGDNWSLTANTSSIPLANAKLLVGNAAGVATAVDMSGDATIANTGALTIANLAVETGMLAADAVTNAKLADDAVSLENLDAGITPSHIVVFAGQPTTVGGAASEAFTVTGAAATDLAFVQVVDDGTAGVTVLQAVVTTNTLTVTFSANPGADTIINYQLLRAAA